MKCLECGCKFKFITATHLKHHGMTVKEYRIKYPEAKIGLET